MQQKSYQISKSSRKCVYCSSESHRSAECDTILTFEDRKKFLATKHLCFNCTGPSGQLSVRVSRSVDFAINVIIRQFVMHPKQTSMR